MRHAENTFLLRSLPLIWFILAMISPKGSQGIEIVRLSVPKLVEDGRKGPFDLDCTYRCGERDDSLVVKWFFNEETIPFYQWIASHGEPVITETNETQSKFLFEEDQHADTCNNKVSYRLVMSEPTVSMSGLYRCEVHTFDSHDSAQANMVVFSPPRNFTLDVSEPSPGTLEVVCSVSPVYPIPDMRLYQILKTDKEEKEAFDDVRIETAELEGHVHQVTLVMKTTNATLFQKQQLTFECDMAFREVKYQRFQRRTYTPEYTTPKKMNILPMRLPVGGSVSESAAVSAEQAASPLFTFAGVLLAAAATASWEHLWRPVGCATRGRATRP